MLYYILGNSEGEHVAPVITFFTETVSKAKRGDIMTLAEQLRAEGMGVGMQQGMQLGRQEEKALIAINLLKDGMDLRRVSSVTGLTDLELMDLKVKYQAETRSHKHKTTV